MYHLQECMCAPFSLEILQAAAAKGLNCSTTWAFHLSTNAGLKLFIYFNPRLGQTKRGPPSQLSYNVLSDVNGMLRLL